MSRHRNIRSMNISDEYEGYDDVYGHSVEDDYCISPSDAAQFLYDREGSKGQQKISAFWKSDEDIAEEDETVADKPSLDKLDEARLESCIETIKSTLEVNIPKPVLTNIVIKNNFDVERSINEILTKGNNENVAPEKKVVKEKDYHNKLHDTNIVRDFSGKVSQLMNFSSLDMNHLQNEDKGSFPKIFSNVAKPDSSGKQFSSLADLTSNHLKNKVIDKSSVFGNKLNLSNNKNKVGFLNKNMSKLSLSKKENENKNWNKEFCIDLSNALRNTPSSQPKPNIPQKTEQFIPQFINCDRVDVQLKKNIKLDYCTMDIKKAAALKNSLDCKVSYFGKVLTHTFRYRTPFIELKCHKRNISMFEFENPSPDDQVLLHIRRK